MGMFDSVYVPCPKCGALNEFQSKGGDCLLNEYTLENAPANVLLDMNRHSPATCQNCGTKYEVKLTFSITKEIVEVST
jgi:uncharacterized Zn-finger protein